MQGIINNMKTIVVGDKFEGKYSYRETCFGIVRNKESFLVVEKNNQYSLVGGGIEENETCKECLKREFLEERYTIKSLNGRTNQMVKQH
jgi:8-oxo-dGTP pyrophosphatase MutT (NUDIX family)